MSENKIVVWGAVLPSAMAIFVFLVAGLIVNAGTAYASLGRIGLVFVSVVFLAVLPLINLWLLAVQPKSRSSAFFLGTLIPGILATITIVAMWNDRYGPPERFPEPIGEVVENINKP